MSWTSIGVVSSPTLPLENVTPGSSFVLSDGTGFEVEGRASGGTGKIYLLRKLIISPTSFFFLPFATDRGFDPAAEAEVSGWFWDRYFVGKAPRGESFVLWSPGAHTVSPARVRGVEF